ncbi:hypothetical protein [Nafulsella turpanensis]|uniref:hypothetical protein n=1 Tax=Nafulsella turpanensis TaxID=1265690 RepID=UPI00034D0695|nr:hypothetical protein [Nafulsella turpanensis]
MQHDLSFLPYFITEDLFLLPEDRQAAAEAATQQPLSPSNANTEAAGKKEENEAPAPVAKAANPAPEKAKATTVNPKLIFGENRKGLLILVEDPNHPIMERADGLFLKDVLKAIQYTFDDVAIVNICQCQNPADWEAINEIPFTHFFSFGVSRQEVPATTTLAPYELEKSKGRKLLMVDKLSVLRAERSRKIALWNLLKQLFV